MNKKNDMLSVFKTLFKYINEHKKWWLVPFFLVLFIFGLFVFFIGNSSVMPLIYAIF